MPASTPTHDVGDVSTYLVHTAQRLSEAEQLLGRCMSQLRSWERRYNDAQPAALWLPPAGGVALTIDIASFLQR